MVGVCVYNIIVSGEQDMCDEFFGKLKQRFPVKILGELKIYTGSAFEHDWDNGTLEMNQTAFAKNMVGQYNISATLNIPGESRCRSRAKKDGESGGNE